MKIKYLACYIYLCLITNMNAQNNIDSVEIYRRCSTPELGVEVITFTQSDVFYFTDARSYSSNDCRIIGLYRYKNFRNFLELNLNRLNVSSIVKVQDSLDAFPDLLNSSYKKSSNDCHGYSIKIYEKGKLYEYVVKTADFWENYSKEYELIKRIDSFFKAFYKEHGCEEGSYFFYTVQKGESLFSIAKKFNVDAQYLCVYNMAHGEGFYFQNEHRRDLDLQEILYGNASLWPNDKLIIPCFPEKREKYEDYLPDKR